MGLLHSGLSRKEWEKVSGEYSHCGHLCAGQFREIVLELPVDVTVNMRPQLKAIICLRKIPLFHTFRKKEIYSQHFF